MGLFMKIQGENPSVGGHAGMLDVLGEIFAPAKQHTIEQQRYEKETKKDQKTEELNFKENKITLTIPQKPKNS